MSEASPGTDAIPAASLILLRDRDDGPEVLAIRRGAAMRFAGDAWAFPGGRVDAADHAAAAAYPDLPDAAFRIAALRETQEETAIGHGATPDAVAALTRYARWQPPRRPGRRFDTHFFLASTDAPGEPAADGVEASAALWAKPRAILAAVAVGDGRLLFPTRCLLERLAGYTSVTDAYADASRYPSRLIVTALETRDGTDWLTIPADLGYPYREQPVSDVPD